MDVRAEVCKWGVRSQLLIKMGRLCVLVSPMRWRVILAVCLLAIAACKTARTAAPVGRAEANSETAVDEPTKDLPPDLYKKMPIFPGATIEHVRKPTRTMREILF